MLPAEYIMYCTSNLPQNQPQSSFHPGSPSYLPYTPTSISQNVLSTVSYTSSSSLSNGSSPTIFSWAHTVPTYMPWAPKPELGSGGGGGLPSVVRFSAPATTVPSDPCTSQTATTWELIHNLGNTCSGMHSLNQHLKRRSDVDSDDDLAAPRPVKQYISEEKMAAKMSQMHISTDYSSYSSGKKTFKSQAKKSTHAAWIPMSEDLSEDSENDESKTLKGSLMLSPELKELMQPNPVLVKALLQERVKPSSMALVLWQPPGGGVREKIKEQQQQSQLRPSSDSTAAPTSTGQLHCIQPGPDANNNNNNNNNTGSANLNLNGTIFGTLDFHQRSLSCSSHPLDLDESDDMEL